MRPFHLAALLSFITLSTASTFDPTCIGDSLRPGEILHRNEVIGPEWNCRDQGYRLGLNAEGWLGYWSFDDEVGWWPGVQGDILLVEPSGNVVLLDKNKQKAWESGCEHHLLSNSAVLRNTGGMAMAEVIHSGKILWRVDNMGQESQCSPPESWTSHPKIKCRGNVLGPKVRLLRDEYICGVGGHDRFGLNMQGKLVMMRGNRVVWSASHLRDGRGDYLLMQKSGKLVLYGDDKVVKWQSGCSSDVEGSILEIKDGGVVIEERGGNILWSINSIGTELGCNQPPTVPVDCSRVSNFGEICQVQMIDTLNTNIVNIKVKDVGNNKFKVIDNFDSRCGEPWTVDVKVRNNGIGKVVIDAGVPEVNCKQMISGYPMEDDNQLIWLRDDTHPCNPFGESLIKFMVEEWFYFG